MRIKITCFCYLSKEIPNSCYYYDIPKKSEEQIEFLGEQSLENYLEEIISSYSYDNIYDIAMIKANSSWNWRIVEEKEKINKTEGWVRYER